MFFFRVGRYRSFFRGYPVRKMSRMHLPCLPHLLISYPSTDPPRRRGHDHGKHVSTTESFPRRASDMSWWQQGRRDSSCHVGTIVDRPSTGGYDEHTRNPNASYPRLLIRHEVDTEEHLEIFGKSKEKTGMKIYLHGAMYYVKKA